MTCLPLAGARHARPEARASSSAVQHQPTRSARLGRPSAVAAASATAASPAVSTTGVDNAPYVYVDGQRTHSLSEAGLDVVRSMSGWAEKELPKYLRPSTGCWQPSDWLPEPSSPDFMDQVAALRAGSQDLPLEYLVVLVGDMVTEEALPSYMNMLNTLDGVRDETGAQSHPWAKWNRSWTAEENRHGDVLNKYLYLSGRVDMHAVESSIQRLIGSGLNPQTENNPYLCFVYTSFQERATKISHANTARLAHYYGDAPLGRICGAIAGDEGRHEAGYSAIVGELFERDPEGALLAFADMMRKGIVMPAHWVDDGWHSEANGRQDLFTDFATVADGLGVYTTQDYASIVEHLVDRWGVAQLRVTSGQAVAAQDFLCKHAERVRRLAELQAERRARERSRGKARSAFFSWVHKREVPLG